METPSGKPILRSIFKSVNMRPKKQHKHAKTTQTPKKLGKIRFFVCPVNTMELFVVSAYLYCCLVARKKTSVVGSDIVRQKPSISFSGCGFRFHFYVGIQEYCLDNFETDDISVLCSSGGVYAAVPLALGRKSSDWMLTDFASCCDYWANRHLDVWLDTPDFLRKLWLGYLPSDAYAKCSGKLFIVISRFTIFGFHEDVISEYASNEDLVDAIVGTTNCIGLFRCPIICKNRLAFDGCFTNLQPQINERLSNKPTIVCKLFGRGTIDYSNRLSILKLMSVVSFDESPAKVAEGYAIAADHHDDFVKAGFTPLTN